MSAPFPMLREKPTQATIKPADRVLRMSATVTPPSPILPPGLAKLLELETKIRATATLQELQFLVANEASVFVENGKVLVLAVNRSGNLRMACASHTGRVDQDAPLVATLEALVAERVKEQQTESKCAPHIGPFLLCTHDNSAFEQAIILPLRWNSRDMGALLFMTPQPWRQSTIKLLHRLADTTAHAWVLHKPLPLLGVNRIGISSNRKGVCFAIVGLALGLISLIPVPMTALAPMRIVTINPVIVAAPIDGVIDEILVGPNDRVLKGTPLLRYVELTFVAKADMAERELAVADARNKRIAMVALSNLEAKRELAIIEAELALKRAERDFARDQLRNSRVEAPVEGIALYGDRRDWTGRPVSAGERILEIGDANQVELQLELPVEDAIAMRLGQPVSAFLDTAPLSPVAAEVTRINHEARVIEGRGLAFVIHARITDGQKPPLGVRGTAHIRGEPAALGLYLFRRPISSFRQWAGL